MANLEQLARDYAAANPTRDGESWHDWCVSLMKRFNNASHSYDNATLAGDNALIESQDAHIAPVGVFHYWYGAGGFGHVAQEVGGRGSRIFMASSHLSEPLGDSIGFVTFDEYANMASGMEYRGWAFGFGDVPPRAADDNGQFHDPAPAPTPAPVLNTYMVVSGDTLWDIAGTHLGDPNRWPEIYALNAAVIGADPDLIYPGQVLVLP